MPFNHSNEKPVLRYFTNPDVPGSLYTRTDVTAKAVLRHHPTWVEVDPPKPAKRPRKGATRRETSAPAETN